MFDVTHHPHPHTTQAAVERDRLRGIEEFRIVKFIAEFEETVHCGRNAWC